MEKSKTTGYAPVNGINMYYEIYGAGAMPLVLIHGGGSTIESTFGNILPILAGRRQIIALELQAHGRTSDRDAPESFEQDADDVAALLKHLNIAKANILGFSNGGSTTMQVAIRHPDRVNKIVVISGAYKRAGFIPDFFEGFPKATLADMPEALRTAYLAVAPDKNGLQVMFEKDVARMQNFKNWDDNDLRSIKAPALIMAADHDVMIPEHAVAISRLIPEARLAILPAVHGSIIGEVGAVGKVYEITAALIEEFLKE
jgi:pimeloyl-ACP methyl ester carboxylesterase